MRLSLLLWLLWLLAVCVNLAVASSSVFSNSNIVESVKNRRKETKTKKEEKETHNSNDSIKNRNTKKKYNNYEIKIYVAEKIIIIFKLYDKV